MFCSKCGNQIEDNQKFCSKCGNQLTTITNNVPKADCENKLPEKKNGKSKTIIALTCCVLAIIIVVSSAMFFKDKESGEEKKETETTIATATEDKVEYIEYYSNVDDWTGKYGLSDLEEFTYNVDGIYKEVATEHLGVISAVEYDCNNDGINELITISLLPTNDGKLYLSPSIITNVNEIKTVNTLDYSSDKLISECPVLDAGNVDVYEGSFISTRVFISNGKLCILHGMYSFAELGRGENFDSIYIYNLSISGIELYRHYYLYEEEIVSDFRNCIIGETITGLSYKFNMNYDTSIAYSVIENYRNEWKKIVNKAISEMRNDAAPFNYDNHFATEREIGENIYTQVLVNSQIYTDEYFQNNELLLDSWFYCEDGDNYVAKSIDDYTKIREKISN